MCLRAKAGAAISKRAKTVQTRALMFSLEETLTSAKISLLVIWMYMMCIWCVCDVYMMCLCYMCYIICVPTRFLGCVEATSSTNSIVKWSGSVGRRRVRWIPLLQAATFPHTPMKIGPVFPLNKPRSSKSKIPSLERNTEKGHLCQNENASKKYQEIIANLHDWWLFLTQKGQVAGGTIAFLGRFRFCTK